MNEQNSDNQKLESAFVRAYDEHAAPIYRHIYFRVNNKGLAEDLTAETFMKTWQYLRTNHDVKNLKGFLYKVADNLVVDHYRIKSRENISLEDIPETSTPSQTFEETVDVQRISFELAMTHLNELPPRHKQILLYRYVDELKIKEIKELTGESATNIYTIIHRSLKTLRKKLNQHEKRN